MFAMPIASDVGAIATTALSNATPANVGTATAGVSTNVSRADHAHALDSTTTSLLVAVAPLPVSIAVVLTTASGQRTLTVTVTGANGAVVPNCPVTILVQTGLAVLTGLTCTTLSGTTDAVLSVVQVGVSTGCVTLCGVTNASCVYAGRLNLALLTLTGTVVATASYAHSVHVVAPVQAGGPWYYRFRAGQYTSPVGRTQAAPSATGGTPPARPASAGECGALACGNAAYSCGTAVDFHHTSPTGLHCATPKIIGHSVSFGSFSLYDLRSVYGRGIFISRIDYFD